MTSINQHILDTLKHYVDETGAPNSLGKIIKNLLEIESTVKKAQTAGIDKLYDQTFQNYVDDSELVEWCKNYVKR